MDRDGKSQRKQVRNEYDNIIHFPPREATIKYVCGVDIGSQSCAGCVTRPDKSVVVKSITIALAREGWQIS
jgi:transposase